MTRRSQMGSPYMEFAKLRSAAKYNLATSGMMSYPLAELPVRIEDLEINGVNPYGYAPLIERLASYNDVPPECVVTSAGTSLANHLAMAATFDPGDEVLIEHPTYELLESTAEYLGAKLRRFERRMEDDFRIDPAEVERSITPQTKLIIADQPAQSDGSVCRRSDDSRGGRDRESAWRAGAGGRGVPGDVLWASSAHGVSPGRHFLVTSSLTKAFGLSGIRCGWVLASAELAHRMWRINDLYAATPVHPAELLGVVAFDQSRSVLPVARGKILHVNRDALVDVSGGANGSRVFRPEQGTIVFPKLRSGDVDEFVALLRGKYETSVVPGSFFDMPQHFRIGIGGEPEMTRVGLERLAQALDEYAGL